VASDASARLRAQLALEALGLRVTLPVLLRALPIDRALALLTPGSLPEARDGGSLAAIEQVTDRLTRDTPGLQTACLKRAAMRYVLLRRHGHAASFVIGVRPGGVDGFEAHAWVTLDGAPIMERAAVDYRRTFVWPREQC
jgi:hypothetical protein